MKRLTAIATAAVGASAGESFDLLRDVERYPAWYPEVVREVTVLARDRDERPVRAKALLRVSRGPLRRDLELTLALNASAADAVTLTRLPNDSQDEEQFELAWRIEAGPETLLRLELTANLDVPRALPLAGAGQAIADGFVAAAARELGGSAGA